MRTRILIAFLVLFCVSAWADSIDDVVARLDGLVPAGATPITDQQVADLVVAGLRSLQVLSVGSTGDVIAKAAPIAFLASLTQSPGDRVAQEARITMAAIGYSTPVLSALVNYSVGSVDSKVSIAVIRLIYQKTTSDRSALRSIGIEKLADLFVDEVKLCRPAGYPTGSATNLPLSELTILVLAPEVEDLTKSQKFSAAISSANPACMGDTRPADATFALGLDHKRLLLDALSDDVRQLQATVAKSGFGNTYWVDYPQINYLTGLLIGFSGDGSNWKEVAGFPPAARAEVTKQMLEIIGDELDIDIQSKQFWGVGGGGIHYFVLGNARVDENSILIFSFIPTLGVTARPLLPHLLPYANTEFGDRFDYTKVVKGVQGL